MTENILVMWLNWLCG